MWIDDTFDENEISHGRTQTDTDILSAMLLMNVVMIKFSTNLLIQNEIRAGRLLSESLLNLIGHEMESRNQSLETLVRDPLFVARITKYLPSGIFTGVMVLDREGVRIMEAGTMGDGAKGAAAFSRECLLTRRSSVDFLGTTWAMKRPFP